MVGILVPLSNSRRRFTPFSVADMRMLVALLPIVLLLGNLVWVKLVLADVRFCNSSPVVVYGAVGYSIDDVWWADSWHKILPSECATVARIDARSTYIYSYIKSERELRRWEGDTEFCVEDYKKGPESEQCDAGKHLKFEMHEPATEPDMQLTFSCDDCSLPMFSFDMVEKGGEFVDSIEKTVGNRTVLIPVDGEFHVSEVTAPGSSKGNDPGKSLAIGIITFVDMTDLQRQIPVIIGDLVNSYDECGVRIQLSDISLNGNGHLSFDFSYAQWLCTSATLPQTTCTPTWITVPGPRIPGPVKCNPHCEETWSEFMGIKTKGLPSCTDGCELTWIQGPSVRHPGVPDCKVTYKDVQTSKNVIGQQSGSAQLAIIPVVSADGRRVDVVVDVNSVSLAGLGQFLVDKLNIDLKKVVQRVLDKTISAEMLGASLPPEFGDAVTFDNPHFMSSNNLYLVVRGRANLSPSRSIDLCQMYWPAAECSPE